MIVRLRLPRVMLSLSISGATYFSVCALRRLPNLDMNSGCSWVFTSDIGLERRLLRKSVVGLGAGFEVSVGSGPVFSSAGFWTASRLFLMASGLGLVEGGDLTGSVSLCASSGSDSSAGESILLSSGIVSGCFTKGSLGSRGLGALSASTSSDGCLGIVSCVKLDVSYFVVGVASFSEICKDSCVSMLVGLELRLAGFVFVGGVTDLGLPALGRKSRESERLSKAGPKGVSFVGDPGRLLSLGLGLPMVGTASTLVLCAFARAIFSIQLGCDGFVGEIFGESGFARALSIQLDLFGLQRFDGLPIGDVSPPSRSAFVLYVDATDLLRLWWRDGMPGLLLLLPSCGRVARLARLLLLELGREFGSWLLSRLLVLMGSSLGMLYELWSPLMPLRVPLAEPGRLKPVIGCALQRLLWLSDLFMSALWTNPPMPLVGEDGRSPAPARRA